MTQYHNLEKFQVRSQLEIASILCRLCERKQMLRMVFADSSETAMSSILDVDSENGIVVFDSLANDLCNRLALECRRIVFETVLDRVRIAFRVSRLRSIRYEEMPAFLSHFPETLVRFQRRDHFRVPLHNAFVRFPVKRDGVVKYAIMPTFDLGAGGVSIVDKRKQFELVPGSVYDGCVLDLPDVVPVRMGLVTRSVVDVVLSGHVSVRRIGFEFHGLGAAESALIGRFVAKVQRELHVKGVDA